MATWDSYADDVDALKSELENLVEARNHVMRRINIDEQVQQQMLPTNEVQLWLSRVQALETEVGELIQQASEEIDRLHPGGFCSGTFNNNKSSSYNELEDMVADKLQAVMKLTEEGAAFLVADKVPVVTTTRDEGYLEMANAETVPEDVGDEFKIVGMESLFDEVCKCLQLQEEEEEEEEEEEDDDDDDDDDGEDDDNNDDDDEEEEEEYEGGEVRIVGIYGMGGVGKTTLLRQIYNKLVLDLQNKIVVVIWVSVSKDLGLEKIQEQIGIEIGMFDKAWRKKSLQDKASDIFNSLKDKKFVLLMDGLWERVDLTRVGVPLSGLKNLSKIVFTTRSLEICSLMEADRQFKVKCLAEEEAWKLFQRSVGDSLHDGHPEVLGLARDVSKECYGLPFALVQIGRAMDGKQTPQEWRDVLEVLRRLRSSISGSHDQLKKDIYYHLKLSYDHLQNDLFKTCLLYCCLFPRSYRICKRDLIECWIGEGFLDDRLGAQIQGYYIIDVLLSTCLLEEEEDDNYVKVHDWIHEMSLWIISEIEKEKRNIFVCTKAGLTELPEIKIWKNVIRLSVANNSITDLNDAPTYLRLQTLFLNHNLFKTISDDFFQYMRCLKVLNLSNNIRLQELPLGISKLISLQHLDLSRTGIKSLSNQLGVLKKLKCLNLEHTFRLHTIPQGLISKFALLHVLRLWGCGVLNNQPVEDSVASNDAQLLIEELLCLKNLSMLSITLRNSHALQKLLSSYGLQSCTQSLRLQLLRHPKSIIVSLTYLKHLNTLQISECECLEELEVDFVRESQAIRKSPHRFNFLHQVLIDSCPNLRDLTCLMLAPNLKRLQISRCSELEEIIKVGKLSECPELIGRSTPFSKLEILELSELPNLRSIYWSVLPFPKLKKSTITSCPKLHISFPSYLLNQDAECEGESEKHGMEITRSEEADVPPEPSALKRKAAEPETEVLGYPELPSLTPSNAISPNLKDPIHKMTMEAGLVEQSGLVEQRTDEVVVERVRKVPCDHRVVKKRKHSKRIRKSIPDVPMVLQELFLLCRDIFKGPGTVPAPCDVERLCRILDNMKPEDVGLSSKLQFFSTKDAVKGAPIVTSTTIYKCNEFSLSLFFLPATGVIPLHNHPEMTGFSKLLLGTMHIKSYDWVDPVKSGDFTPSSQRRLAKLVVDSDFTAPCNTSVLYPTTGGNIREFTAITACAVLDVLGPPYSKDDGRDCSYYNEFPYSADSSGKKSLTEKEGEYHGWLEEIEMPENSHMDEIEYLGPQIIDTY